MNDEHGWEILAKMTEEFIRHTDIKKKINKSPIFPQKILPSLEYAFIYLGIDIC